MKFVQLILRRIVKIVATKCQILKLKCTKIDFGWGSAPDPAGGAYSAPQTPKLDLRGPTSKGRGYREGGERGRGRGRQGRERMGGESKEGKEGRGGDPRVHL